MPGGALVRAGSRYLLALALTAMALGVGFALTGQLPSTCFPFLTFFPAVLLATYWGGLGPGLLATGLGIASAWYFFLALPSQFPHLSRPDTVALAFFSLALMVDCVVIDVMKRALARVRRTEARLRGTEHRLRLVLDRLPVSVSILDTDGARREVNQATQSLGPIERGTLVGRKYWDAPWWSDDPLRRQMVRDAVERAARGEVVQFDAELRTLDRSQRTVSVEIAPLREPDGQITALVASAVDVTERVQALADLRRSRAAALEAVARAERDQRLLDAVFNAVPAGIIIADAQGRLLRMNRANERIWGVAPYSTQIAEYGDWKGWWAGDSPMAGQRIAADEWGLARSLRTGRECKDIVEIEPFGRPGKRLVTLLSSAPVLDPQGAVVGGVVVQVDITDRIQAERALREADRQKDTFLATLSHELRNPLAPIRSAAHIIRLSPAADPRAQRAAGVIERQSAQLARLVDDLLDVSRLNFGSLTLQRQRVDLRQVVQDALEASRPLAEANQHQLLLTLCAEPLPVNVDHTRIAQCVSNLVNNASKFTPAGGRIQVDVAALDGRWATVTVTDNGQGIEPAMLERVFDLFTQERRSGMGGNSGLGIGLALVRRLVQMHDGQVHARSDGPGKGSTFELRLPLQRQDSDPGATEISRA